MSDISDIDWPNLTEREVGVVELREALEAAYDAGRKSAEGKK